MITYSKKRITGFTLIEVLVASLIAFISLSIFTLIFRGAIIANQKAENAMQIASIASLVTSDISNELLTQSNQNSLSGQGALLGGSYQWQATVIDVYKPPVRFVGAQVSQAEHRLKKWRVRFAVTFNGIDTNYEYEELSW
ncbi:PulJ/GspJ family protein [Thalassotalea euphylliae]|uniref:Prepilin-type N-terminal cleavage/methylation domain-containing protein n=1 Tax=Thalassotalea euphylliae TaxID=1655234 RepID=A0A3E0U2I6_9GAMM|nr:prepilin-type N-terminal cleavage/methylation domain-containing protein [Thalassotalea euphylliae]REL30232.1 prepilin-type N-terminal cleavage/methylation domain-containing protein [Thalassotalea euphylliae]